MVNKNELKAILDDVFQEVEEDRDRLKKELVYKMSLYFDEDSESAFYIEDVYQVASKLRMIENKLDMLTTDIYLDYQLSMKG